MTRIPVTLKATTSVGDTKDPAFYGMYLGSVVNINDPLNLGRVLLKIPQVLGMSTSNWAIPLGSAALFNVSVGQIVGVFFISGNRNLPAYIPQTFPRTGSATLSGGTVTVPFAVTNSSKIFLSAQDNNTTGALRVSSRIAGTSFTITSSNTADSGVVAYEVM